MVTQALVNDQEKCVILLEQELAKLHASSVEASIDLKILEFLLAAFDCLSTCFMLRLFITLCLTMARW